ncbi:MAG: spike base protein, RCAP_Rcc01079 family [Geminicoccaceae bacterium]
MSYRNAERYDATPARSASSVTPNDSTVLERTKGVWVGGSGDMSVVMHNGNTVTFAGIVAGSLLPIAVSRIRSTGTTATAIVALF